MREIQVIQVSVINLHGEIIRYRCSQYDFFGGAFVMGNAVMEHANPNEPVSTIALYPLPGTTIGIAR
jgi:hypothetical protein